MMAVPKVCKCVYKVLNADSSPVFVLESREGGETTYTEAMLKQALYRGTLYCENISMPNLVELREKSKVTEDELVLEVDEQSIAQEMHKRHDDYATFEQYKFRAMLMGTYHDDEFVANLPFKIILSKAYPDSNGVYAIPSFVTKIQEDCFSHIEAEKLTVIHKNNRVKCMSRVFNFCKSKCIDLSDFDTTGCVNMSGMFNQCSEMEILIQNFDTSAVKSMSYMFYNCTKIKTLNLSNFTTGNVLTMEGMFQACCSLKTLNLSSFHTHKVTNMNSMFLDCICLDRVNLKYFNNKVLKTAFNMFGRCRSLRKISFPCFKPRNINCDVTAMFYACYKLETVELPHYTKLEAITFKEAAANSRANITTLDGGYFS